MWKTPLEEAPGTDTPMCAATEYAALKALLCRHEEYMEEVAELKKDAEEQALILLDTLGFPCDKKAAHVVWSSGIKLCKRYTQKSGQARTMRDAMMARKLYLELNHGDALEPKNEKEEEDVKPADIDKVRQSVSGAEPTTKNLRDSAKEVLREFLGGLEQVPKDEEEELINWMIEKKNRHKLAPTRVLKGEYMIKECVAMDCDQGAPATKKAVVGGSPIDPRMAAKFGIATTPAAAGSAPFTYVLGPGMAGCPVPTCHLQQIPMATEDPSKYNKNLGSGVKAHLAFDQAPTTACPSSSASSEQKESQEKENKENEKPQCLKRTSAASDSSSLCFSRV
eukprot:g8515.t1